MNRATAASESSAASQSFPPQSARLAGCQSAMLRLGLPFEMEKQYAYARFSLHSGYEAMEYLLKHSPDITAVFAMSDLMALGAIRALRDHGLRVPQDISGHRVMTALRWGATASRG